MVIALPPVKLNCAMRVFALSATLPCMTSQRRTGATAEVRRAFLAAVKKAMQLHVAAHGSDFVRPKHHYLFHAAEQPSADGLRLDCFVLERKHNLLRSRSGTSETVLFVAWAAPVVGDSHAAKVTASEMVARAGRKTLTTRRLSSCLRCRRCCRATSRRRRTASSLMRSGGRRRSWTEP